MSLRTFIGFRGTPAHMWSFAVAEFTSREMHLIKRALAIAHSDDANLKALLIKLVKSDVELVMYVREARIALAGQLTPPPWGD